MTKNISFDDLKLLAEMDDRIGDAGGPTLAFTLMNQKRALEDRLSFKRWLAQNDALIGQTDEQNERAAKAAAAMQLSRRAQMLLMSF